MNDDELCAIDEGELDVRDLCDIIVDPFGDDDR